MLDNPSELITALRAIFPDFLCNVEQEEDIQESIGLGLGLHSVMSCFAEYFGKKAHSSSERQLRALGGLLDTAVATGGKLENAVFTCFLEHAHQLRINRLLSSYLSRATKTRRHPRLLSLEHPPQPQRGR